MKNNSLRPTVSYYWHAWQSTLRTANWDDHAFWLVVCVVLAAFPVSLVVSDLWRTAEPSIATVEIEQIVSSVILIDSIEADECETATKGCQIIFHFADSAETHQSDAMALRQRFLQDGWSETRFNTSDVVATGSYERDDTYATFAFVGPAWAAQCMDVNDRTTSLVCGSGLYLGIPSR